MSEPLILDSNALAWETWDAAQIETRGRVFWKTLFCRNRVGTESLTGGIALVHPGDALFPHHHAPAEIYFILQGEGVMTLGETEHIVRAGNAVFIPGDMRHGIANASDTDVIFLYAFARDSFDEVVYHFPQKETAA